MAKQGELEGIEKPGANPEVDAAAENLREIKKKRMRLTKKEKEAKVQLIVVMKKHNLTVYRDETAQPPIFVNLINKDDVQIRDEGVTNEEDDEQPGDEDPGAEAANDAN